MDFKTYTDAVTQQKTDLTAYVSKNVAAIELPVSKDQMRVGKKNFNTVSGWVFNILGILAFIIGLIVGIGGIWITGCAALTAGTYLIIKGKQELTQEAYDNVGDALVAGVDRVLAYVSKTWTDFVNAQFVSLRKDIVTSNLADDDKVKALGRITNSSYVHVDIDRMRDELSKIDVREKLKLYQEYLPVAAKEVNEAVSLAATAQSDIYMEIIGPMPQPKKATSAASAPDKPAAPATPAPDKPAAPAPDQPAAPATPAPNKPADPAPDANK